MRRSRSVSQTVFTVLIALVLLSMVLSMFVR